MNAINPRPPRRARKTALAAIAAAAVVPTMLGAGAVFSLKADGAPTLEAIKSLIENSTRAFNEFKEANDKRLKEIEAKGVADPTTVERVEKLNAAVTDYQAQQKAIVEQMKALENQIGRAGLGGAGSAADVQAEANKFYAMIRGDDEVAVSAADVTAYTNYLAAFGTYCRRGDKAVSADIQAALSVGSDPDGGYWVPPTRSAEIIKRLFDTSPVRQYAGQTTIGTDAYEAPLDVNDATSGGWVAELGTRSETNTPQGGGLRIEAHEQYAQPAVTQKLLDDAQFDVEGWLTGKIADKLSRTENTGFVTGNGVGKPRGFMSYAANSATVSTQADAQRAWGKVQYVVTGASGGFQSAGGSPVAGDDADCLIDLVHSMKRFYRQGAIWCANRLTFAALRKIKDGDGNYLWSMGNVAAGQPNTLLGYPTDDFDDMADIGANSFSVAFANLKEGYLIVDRAGIRVLRDPFTAKPKILFYTTKRTGGDVTNFDAIKYLKFGTS